MNKTDKLSSPCGIYVPWGEKNYVWKADVIKQRYMYEKREAGNIAQLAECLAESLMRQVWWHMPITPTLGRWRRGIKNSRSFLAIQ